MEKERKKKDTPTFIIESKNPTFQVTNNNNNNNNNF